MPEIDARSVRSPQTPSTGLRHPSFTRLSAKRLLTLLGRVLSSSLVAKLLCQWSLQTPSAGLRHLEEGAGKRCSECEVTADVRAPSAQSFVPGMSVCVDWMTTVGVIFTGAASRCRSPVLTAGTCLLIERIDINDDNNK